MSQILCRIFFDRILKKIGFIKILKMYGYDKEIEEVKQAVQHVIHSF